MTAVDVHQHLWPEEVLRVLERRTSAPRATWQGSTWRVRLAREPEFIVDPADHDPGRRVADLAALGVDRALVALSGPVGAEISADAVAAWTASSATLPAALGWWAAVPGDVPAADQTAVIRDAAAAGAAGLCLPATLLRSIAATEEVLPLLAGVEATGVPLFVHPGPVADGDAADPGWWSPATAYVAQMHAAWHAFHAVARPALPGLRVVFALLAGLAPLQLERTTLRGGALPAAVADPRSFYDTSGYGPRALRGMACLVGTGQFVYGSDHPVVTPATDPLAGAFGDDVAALARRESVARVLGRVWTPA